MEITCEERLLLKIIELYVKGINDETIDINTYNINKYDFMNLMSKNKLCGVFYRLLQNGRIKNYDDNIKNHVVKEYSIQYKNNENVLKYLKQYETYFNKNNIKYILTGNIVIHNNICGPGHIDIGNIGIIIPERYNHLLNIAFDRTIRIINELSFAKVRYLFYNYDNNNGIYYHKKYLTPELLIIYECIKLYERISDANFNEYSYDCILNILLIYKAFVETNTHIYTNIINKSQYKSLCMYVFNFINDIYNNLIISLDE